jgi:hypothetical protein
MVPTIVNEYEPILVVKAVNTEIVFNESVKIESAVVIVVVAII